MHTTPCAGNIPENIGSLLELTVLTLTHNQLSGMYSVYYIWYVLCV